MSHGITSIAVSLEQMIRSTLARLGMHSTTERVVDVVGEIDRSNAGPINAVIIEILLSLQIQDAGDASRLQLADIVSSLGIRADEEIGKDLGVLHFSVPISISPTRQAVMSRQLLAVLTGQNSLRNAPGNDDTSLFR